MSNAVYPDQLVGLGFTVTKTPMFSTIVNKSSGGSEVRVRNYANPLWKWTLIYDVLFGEGSTQAMATQPYGWADIDYLMGFFLARSGEFDDFLFFDPDDNTVINQPQPFVTDGGGNWYTPFQRTMGGQFAEDITDLQSFTGLYLNGTLIPVNNDSDNNWQLGGPGLIIPGSFYGGVYAQWAPWLANYSYSVGTFLIDAAGHLQMVTAATGASSAGPNPPTFNDSGSTTTDGDVTWTDQGLVTATTATFSFYFRVRFGSDDQDFEKFLDDLWTIGGDDSKNGKGTLELVTSRLPVGSTSIGTPPYIPSNVLTPPPGVVAITLWPYEPNPGVSGSSPNGSYPLGSYASSANGSSGGIMASRGPYSLSISPFDQGSYVATYQLPASILRTQVVAAFAVVYGTRTDGMPQGFPKPPTDPSPPKNPFGNGYAGNAFGYYNITGLTGGIVDVQPGGGSSSSASFVAQSAVIQIAPVSPLMVTGLARSFGYLSTLDNFYPGMALNVILEQSMNGYLNSNFNGGMVIVVWYKP